MTHVWIGRRLLPERHGQPCRLLVARRGKYLLQFDDGWRVVLEECFRQLKLFYVAEALCEIYEKSPVNIAWVHWLLLATPAEKCEAVLRVLEANPEA